MSLRDIFKIIEDTATQFPDIHSFYEGNIYELNEGQSVDYSSVVVTQDQHVVDMIEQKITYNLYIFYVDRENNDGSNVDDIQSGGITRLNTIINTLADSGFIITNYTIDTFRERFSSLCAGAYAHVGMTTALDICDTFGIVEGTTTTTTSSTTTTTQPPITTTTTTTTTTETTTSTPPAEMP